VVNEGVVYVGTSDGTFHAASAADGSELWKWKGASRIDGRAVVQAANVCFVDGRIELVCLDRAKGTERWRFPLHDVQLAGAPVPDNPTFNRRTATPLLLDGAVYAGSSDGALYCVDAATGKQLWRAEAGSPIFSGVAQIAADVLAFGCMDGSVVMLDRRTHAEVRRIKTGGGVVTTPVAAGGTLIVGSRDYMLYGFELESGAAAWSFSYGFSWIESTPRLEGGVLYVGASDFRRVTALRPVDGKALWSTDVRGLAWGTPLVTVDTVFIGTVAQNIPGTVIHHTGGIMALDRRSGAVKWHRALPDPPQGAFGGYAGSLALAGDLLIAAGFDGALTAYPTK
jgi:outer membrane protein assembly factor BamB